MTPDPIAPGRRHWRSWPIWGVPRHGLIYLLVVDALAIVASVGALVALHANGNDGRRFALLLVLALLFEEGAKKVAQLRLRLGGELRRDMAAVWSVSGALVLPAGLAVALVWALYGWKWSRVYHPAGEHLYRKITTASTVALGCLFAHALVNGAVASLGEGWSFHAVSGVLFGMAAFTVTNRILVSVGLLLLGAPVKALVGSADENLSEVATLCLGGLTTLTVLFEPWLTPLVLAPMVSLQRGALVRQLEAVASTDSKTGLLNALAWEQVAVRELARAQRDGSAIGILIIDIDWFKRINDRFGHLVGDAVLKGVGKVVEGELRGYDTVGRFGGEEFVVVLPGASTDEAMAAAERIRARVGAERVSTLVTMPEQTTGDSIAVSIGVAVAPTDGVELTELLHAADGALYAAKANGRNQVQLARRGGGQTVRMLAGS